MGQAQPPATAGMIETSSPDAVAEKIATVISDELGAEDRLNDEVRDLLSQYAEYMRREGVSYSEMFRRIKNTMISQRKVIRAAGRDTGDNMKLSRDKINDISHKLVTSFRKAREFRLKKDPNDVRLEIVRSMTELLSVEEKVDRAARTKIRIEGVSMTSIARERGREANVAAFAATVGRHFGEVFDRQGRAAGLDEALGPDGAAPAATGSESSPATLGAER